MKVAKLDNGQPEIYLAVQGEGKTIGRPLVFVRFSLCNLHCVYCDTFYTWNFENTPWEHDFAPKCSISKEQIDMTAQEIAEHIKKVASPNKGVVFTGGEPTLHQKGILKIMDILSDEWYYEIETNGTIKFDERLLERINQINCSPKLEDSGNNEKIRYKPEVLGQICRANGIFKFVVGTIEQVDEIERIVNEIGIKKENIYLMPQGVKTNEIIEGSRSLNEVCMKLGWNMSTRLQVILYDQKRAV